MQEKHDNMISK